MRGMRIVIVGPGALGSVIGATLPDEGTRSPCWDAGLRICRPCANSGLRLETRDGTSEHVSHRGNG